MLLCRAPSIGRGFQPENIYACFEEARSSYFLCRSGYPTVFGTAPTKDSSGAELLCFQLDCVRSERTRCNMRAINDRCRYEPLAKSRIANCEDVDSEELSKQLQTRNESPFYNLQRRSNRRAASWRRMHCTANSTLRARVFRPLLDVPWLL